MPKVNKPFIRQEIRHGAVRREELDTLVSKLEVVLKLDLGPDAISLSLWTEPGKSQTIQPALFCLSVPAARRLSQELELAVEAYLDGHPEKK